MDNLEDEYVVGTYGTTYRAIDVFRAGEMQGTHNENLRIIKLLQSKPSPCSDYVINLINNSTREDDWT